MAFVVSSTSLNLRSQPQVSPGNRLALLHQGQVVQKLADASVPGWWQISAAVDGVAMTGFAASQFLAAQEVSPPPPGSDHITAVYLLENSPVAKRDSTAGRAYPLGEPDRPSRGNGTPDQRKQGLIGIIDYLDVERRARYQPAVGSTYCNIYACDYCYLGGVYLPRVWWTAKAISDLTAGRAVPVKYGDTVRELNANALLDWLRDFGPEFGWSRAANLDDLQAAADQGSVCLICAQRTDLERPGHICAVAPEETPHLAQRGPDGVDLPLQSQAGATNFCFSCGTAKWWASAEFRSFGFWVHP